MYIHTDVQTYVHGRGHVALPVTAHIREHSDSTKASVFSTRAPSWSVACLAPTDY